MTGWLSLRCAIPTLRPRRAGTAGRSRHCPYRGRHYPCCDGVYLSRDRPCPGAAATALARPPLPCRGRSYPYRGRHRPWCDGLYPSRGRHCPAAAAAALPRLPLPCRGRRCPAAAAATPPWPPLLYRGNRYPCSGCNCSCFGYQRRLPRHGARALAASCGSVRMQGRAPAVTSAAAASAAASATWQSRRPQAGWPGLVLRPCEGRDSLAHRRLQVHLLPWLPSPRR